MDSRNTIIAVVVLVIILVVGAFGYRAYRRNATVAPPNPPSESTSTPAVETSGPTASSSGAMSENVVTISSNGFSPKTITIKAGDKVTWVNADSVNHQVASSPHPTHTDYPPLNTVGLLKPGDKGSLMFPDKGTYKYHDHLNPSLTGIVTVQ